MSMLELANGFHNLEGTLVHEKKKNLFKLLKNVKKTQLDARESDSILNGIKPTTYLEKLLYVDVLIYFQKKSNLLEILKSGDEVLISKIIKCSWFIEYLREIEPKVFVNELLPLTSYSIRVKILKKICETTDYIYVDQIFDEIFHRYGLPIALIVLANCSANKIEDILKNNNVTLKHSQLLTLFHRDRKLLELYVNQYKENDPSYKKGNKKILKTISKEDPAYYLEFSKKVNFVTKAGKRVSRKILTNQQDIIGNYETYEKVLRTDILIRKLQGKAREVLLKQFPREIESYQYYGKIQVLVHCLPKTHRFAIFVECFEKKYNKTIWENPDYLNKDEFLPIMTIEEKEKFGRFKYKETNETQYLKFYPVSEAIPLLKNLVNVSAKSLERLQAVRTMFECCLIRDDFETLTSIFKYFSTRHCTGDTENMRIAVLRAIENSKKMEQLNETHWTYIQEIVAVNRTKKTNVSDCKDLRFAYIQFLYNHNKPLEEELSLLFNDCCGGYCSYMKSDSIKDPKLERNIICFGIKEMEKIKSSEDLNEDNMFDSVYLIHIRYAEYIYEFNKKNPTLKIKLEDIPSWERSIRYALQPEKNESFKYEFGRFTKDYFYNELIMNTERSEKETELLQMFVTHYKTNESHFLKEIIAELFMKVDRNESENWFLSRYKNSYCEQYGDFYDGWILKYFPTLIQKNIVGFVKEWQEMKGFQITNIKKYHHINLDTECISVLTDWIVDKEFEGRKDYFVRFLSFISSPDNYLELAEKYVPKSDKVNMKDTDESKLYVLQCEILKNLRNVPSANTLPLVLKFCRGDYFQTSIKSLYSTVCHTQEYLVSPHVKSLLNKAVSVRKHAIFLASIVLTQEVIREMLKNSIASEKDTSSRKYLFTTCLKYFRKNPSDELFDMVKTVLNFLVVDDVESFETLTTISKIPRKYRSDYTQYVLALYDKYEEQNVKIRKCKTQVLEAINEDIVKGFTTEYCKGLIEKYFIVSKERHGEICKFIITFLKFHKSDNKQDDFNFVFNIVKNYWGKDDKIAEGRVVTFFNDFFNDAKFLERSFNDYINSFTSHFSVIFEPITSFKEFCQNNMLILHRKSVEPILNNFAQNIRSFTKDLFAKLNGELYCLHEFVDCITAFLTKLTPEETTLFWYNLLIYDTDTPACLMVLIGLKNLKPNNSQYYNNIVEIIKKFDNASVQLHYNLYLRKQN